MITVCDTPALLPSDKNPQIKVDIDDGVIIVCHVYTGTQTIQEIYEDFLKRKLENI